jgi:hypothetical protein
LTIYPKVYVFLRNNVNCLAIITPMFTLDSVLFLLLNHLMITTDVVK